MDDDLATVKRFVFAREILETLEALFQRLGEDGYEGVAYLAGKRKGEEFLIDTLAVPVQSGLPVEYGCSLHVPGSEFTRLAELLVKKGRQYCGQIHSHPEDAFHSLADDRCATMRFSGALSLVTPRFGASGAMPKDAAVFRFNLKRGWVELPQRAWNNLLGVSDMEASIIGPE